MIKFKRDVNRTRSAAVEPDASTALGWDGKGKREGDEPMNNRTRCLQANVALVGVAISAASPPDMTDDFGNVWKRNSDGTFRSGGKSDPSGREQKETAERFKKSDLNSFDALKILIQEGGDPEAAYREIKKQLDEEDRNAMERTVAGVKGGFAKALAGIKSAAAKAAGATAAFGAALGKAAAAVGSKAEELLEDGKKEVGELLTKEIPALIQETVKELKSDPMAAVAAVACVGAGLFVSGVAVPSILASATLPPAVAIALAVEWGAIAAINFGGAILNLAKITEGVAERLRVKKQREAYWDAINLEVARRRLKEIGK